MATPATTKKRRKPAQVYTCPEHGQWKPPHPPKADCTPCWALYGRWRRAKDLQGAVKSVGRLRRGGGQASKAKGRAGVEAVVALLRKTAPWLGEADIYIKTSAVRGVDLHLSPAAQAWLNYAIEVKNTEGLNIWQALKQAESNATTCPPLLFFKRAFTDLYVALRATDFLTLLPCPVNVPPHLPPPAPSPTAPEPPSS